MSILIRSAGPDDADRLARLHAQCFEEAWNADSFRDLLAGASFALLAQDATASDLQGFILIQVAGGEAEILTFGTAPIIRRRGLARALLLEAAKVAQDRGASVLHLEVAHDNAPALGLYRSTGFVTVGRRPAYYTRAAGKSADALMLSAKLPL